MIRALPTLVRFERSCVPEPNSGCWLWLGATTTFGYGKTFKRLAVNIFKQIDAHRLAWEIYRGEIPDGLFVLHRCDVPQCVNPDHLFLGTQGDNVRDAVAKGRPFGDRGRWTHCKNGHPLEPDNLVKGVKQRRCRACANSYAREYNKAPKGRAHMAARNIRRRKEIQNGR